MISTNEDKNDLFEDFLEISWLLEELKNKQSKIPIKKFNLLTELPTLENEVELGNWTFEKFIRIKYEIRTRLKLAAGLLTAHDWQSPAYEGDLEHGIQTERGTYMRTNGSDFVNSYQNKYLNEFFEIPDKFKSKIKGFVTCSGMKSLEVALYMYKLTMESLGESNIPPVYIQKGVYYESIALCKFIFNQVEMLIPEEIYKILQSDQEIGCLLLEPGTLWPPSQGVQLKKIFDLLKNKKVDKPFFIIIDRTTASILSQPFYEFLEDSPINMILIIFESSIKYNQYGLDMCNQGFVAIYGNMIRHKKYSDLMIDILNITSAFPHPVTLQALPSPNRNVLLKRLYRLNRNSSILHRELLPLVDQGKVSALYKAFESEGKIRTSRKYQWTGGYILIRLQGVSEKVRCETLIREVSRKNKDSFIFTGGSFGFDSTRLSVLEDITEPNSCAIRISMGRDISSTAHLKASKIRCFLENI